ncbi:MAG: lmo0937 family membrane protein [Saprospiraceae bacterium]|nr:lmo0937 family membrane protein [Saprospiraceae bacterium]
MGNILYTIALIMILFWAIGFFAYGAGALIHILLVVALISFLIKIISGERIAE